MILSGRHIELLDLTDSPEMGKEELTIGGCRIGLLSLTALNFTGHVTIKDCIIGELILQSTAFIGGLTFTGNIVQKELWYEEGGHNENDINISGNIFNGFVGSVDCQFDAKVIVRNNIFMEGCDWLLIDGAGDNYYDHGHDFRDNIGRTDVYFWYYPLRRMLIETPRRMLRGGQME